MMGFLLLSVVVMTTWCLLQNSLSLQNLVVGFALGAVMALVLRDTAGWQPKSRDVLRPKKIYHLANYLLHLAMEIVVSNINVTKHILSPRLKIRPGIVAVPLDVEGDVPITTFANSITLTPGTISMVVSSDQKTIYVHSLDIEAPKESKQEMKACLEKYVKRVSD